MSGDEIAAVAVVAVLGFWIPMPPAIQLRTRDSAIADGSLSSAPDPTLAELQAAWHTRGDSIENWLHATGLSKKI